MTYITELLNAGHDRSAFSCGEDSLDRLLKTQAGQHMRKSHACVAFVFPDEKGCVLGYYTLSSEGIPYSEIPDALKKLVPPYRSLGVTLLGRLAVDRGAAGKKLGTRLLLDALARCYDTARHSVGSVAVIVDPVGERAAEWYGAFGFIPLPDQSRLFLPMKTIDDLFSLPAKEPRL